MGGAQGRSAGRAPYSAYVSISKRGCLLPTLSRVYKYDGHLERLRQQAARLKPVGRVQAFSDVGAPVPNDQLPPPTAELAKPQADGAEFAFFELHINYACSYGEQVAVLGGCEQLGNWDPARAVSMSWQPGHDWTVALQLPASSIDAAESHLLDYKYLVTAADGSVVHWQQGPNLQLQLPTVSAATQPATPAAAAPGTTLLSPLVVYDSWDLPVDCDPARSSGAVQAVPPELQQPQPLQQPQQQPQQQQQGSSAATAELVPVQFTTQCEVSPWQRVAVVGSCEQLGGWQQEQGLALVWQEGNMWVGQTQLPAGECMDFKFVVLAEDGSVCYWHEGDNLQLLLSQNGSSSSNSNSASDVLQQEQGVVVTVAFNWHDGSISISEDETVSSSSSSSSSTADPRATACVSAPGEGSSNSSGMLTPAAAYGDGFKSTMPPAIAAFSEMWAGSRQTGQPGSSNGKAAAANASTNASTNASAIASDHNSSSTAQGVAGSNSNSTMGISRDASTIITATAAGSGGHTTSPDTFSTTSDAERPAAESHSSSNDRGSGSLATEDASPATVQQPVLDHLAAAAAKLWAAAAALLAAAASTAGSAGITAAALGAARTTTASHQSGSDSSNDSDGSSSSSSNSSPAAHETSVPKADFHSSSSSSSSKPGRSSKETTCRSAKAAALRGWRKLQGAMAAATAAAAVAAAADKSSYLFVNAADDTTPPSISCPSTGSGNSGGAEASSNVGGVPGVAGTPEPVMAVAELAAQESSQGSGEDVAQQPLPLVAAADEAAVSSEVVAASPAAAGATPAAAAAANDEASYVTAVESPATAAAAVDAVGPVTALADGSAARPATQSSPAATKELPPAAAGDPYPAAAEGMSLAAAEDLSPAEAAAVSRAASYYARYEAASPTFKNPESISKNQKSHKNKPAAAAVPAKATKQLQQLKQQQQQQLPSVSDLANSIKHQQQLQRNVSGGQQSQLQEEEAAVAGVLIALDYSSNVRLSVADPCDPVMLSADRRLAAATAVLWGQQGQLAGMAAAAADMLQGEQQEQQEQETVTAAAAAAAAAAAVAGRRHRA